MISYQVVTLYRGLFLKKDFTSPSPPPLMTLLQSLVVAMAVTPILWALLMTYINRPVSGAKARIFPSSHAGRKGKQKQARSIHHTLTADYYSPKSQVNVRTGEQWRGWRKEANPLPLSRFPKLVVPGWGKCVACLSWTCLHEHPAPREGSWNEEEGGRPAPTLPWAAKLVHSTTCWI